MVEGKPDKLSFFFFLTIVAINAVKLASYFTQTTRLIIDTSNVYHGSWFSYCAEL